MKNNRIKRSFFIPLLLISFWLLLFEYSSYLILKRWGDPLDKAYEVIEAHSQLGWKQKSSLNTLFYDEKLTTNADGFRHTSPSTLKDHHYNIMTLGPSSAFGWGVSDNDTYSHLFSELIANFSHKKTLSLNLSQIGHSSFQGYKLYEEQRIQNLKPQLLLISYGVNDIDKFRFFFSSPQDDINELSTPKPKQTIRLLNTIHSSYFLRLVTRTVAQVSTKFSCKPLTSPPVERLSLQNSFKYLSKIIEKAQSKDVSVILVNTPFKLPTPSENLDKKWLNLNSMGLEAKKSGDLDSAIKYFKDSLDSNQNQTVAHYQLMTLYALQQECFSASKHLALARENEPSRIHGDLLAFNKELSYLSNKYKIKLLDAHTLLAQNEQNFVDPIHPSKRGHNLIAKELFKLWVNNINE